MSNSNLYTTTKNLSRDRKLIYVIGVPNSNFYKGWVKIGDASEPTLEQDNRPNSSDLRKDAKKRVNQYMHTAGLPFNIDWTELAYNNNSGEFFRDYDVHNVLERSGYKRYPHTEWFKVTPQIAREAIQAVKDGKTAISNNSKSANITFRPEQRDIIKKTDKLFKLHNKKSNEMLWNAKMRFGKTLCALEVAKDMNYHRILIVTHRPVVNGGWFDDFHKLLGNDERYSYGSKTKGHNLNELRASNKRFFYFASLQDLVGSTYASGKFHKDAGVFNTNWDLLIIDEAHEGTQTQKAQNVINNLPHKKELLLSGTPFNLLNNHHYNDNQICTWNYIDEQSHKKHWTDQPNHTDENNPYSVLPKVSMYTFHIGSHFEDFVDPYSKTFDFSKFFKVDPNGHFHYEKYVKQFLKNITTPNSKTNYPYSTRLYRDRVKHSLWILPNRKSASALEKLMKQNNVFKDFGIINVVKDNDDPYSTSDVKQVEDTIKKYDHTITLTVRKLTLGVTIPQWTAVVFLADTSSASQYLQSAFRAQSPYVRKDKHGNPISKKTNCYIFDFSPERALTMATKTVQLNPTRHGKLLKKDQENHLRELLNFMPVLGEKGNSMQKYDINTLLQNLKKNYAERAVNTGFDDNSLYNDNLLLKLNKVDLKDFEHLEAIVGVTKSHRKKNKIIINDQGLNKAEYNTANDGLNKSANDRTPEEQQAIDKMNKAKRVRRTLISVLRSMSIRIPLMIYGMNVDFNDEVNINQFADRIDKKSWAEFMPNGVTQKFFNRFTKYYDPDVFIKAGKIIRAKVKAIDNLDPMERTDKIAEIFSHFRNPDKETVLTPWRVVNMHLGRTLGGLSHYDDHYNHAVKDNHWINDSDPQIFNPYVNVLEINSKTGLYPLYMATSLYYQAFNQMDTNSAGRFNYHNELNLWYRILNSNIFMIAKTPMAKQIAIRTLVGYKKDNLPDLHIIYEKDLVQKAKDDPDKEVSKIEKRFNNMKFDCVIGNPPYQKSDNGARASADPIYQYFVSLSEKLSSRYVSLIMPAKWYVGGKGLDKFRAEMLNDKHIKELYDFMTPEDVFPNTNIRGGLTIFLWDRLYDNSKKGVRVVNIKHGKVIGDTYRPLKLGSLNMFIRNSKAFDILNKIPLNKETMDTVVSARNPFNFGTNFINTKEFHDTTKRLNHPIKMFGRRKIGYVERKLINKNTDWISKYKVFTSGSNNIGTELRDDNLNTIIGSPNTVCTDTYMVIGASLNLDKQSTINLSKYLKTKFSRYLISLDKSTQHAPRKTYQFVPIQNFSDHSDINWNQSLNNIDHQLFDKYRFNDDQRKLVTHSIKDLTND